MDHDTALALLKANITDDFTVKHCLALEAVMVALAKKFEEDEEKWANAGLLHDIDLGIVGTDMTKHSLVGGEMLEKAGFPADVVHAVKAHNGMHGLPRDAMIDKAVYSGDNLTGLIMACAKVQPDKKLASVRVESVVKKFKDKHFAAATDRDRIRTCEEFMPLNDFIALSLEAMQGIAPELGL